MPSILEVIVENNDQYYIRLLYTRPDQINLPLVTKVIDCNQFPLKIRYFLVQGELSSLGPAASPPPRPTCPGNCQEIRGCHMWEAKENQKVKFSDILLLRNIPIHHPNYLGHSYDPTLYCATLCKQQKSIGIPLSKNKKGSSPFLNLRFIKSVTCHLWNHPVQSFPKVNKGMGCDLFKCLAAPAIGKWRSMIEDRFRGYGVKEIHFLADSGKRNTGRFW
ncbi:hypothetical protein BCR42DRAFT_465600 [Absidia repens]|uniref:Uncharacterized protein n=1 Tax=Absidia repens TaxID=90262 RepID=A0A1X2IGM5_9FUNG|nr:hypothetical protein BCR42DRAFT_465600 [Absidia repens]